jgi:hypothetical protein
MSITLIDRIGSVTFQNGLLRVDCVSAGPNNEERPSGTLLIPANQAGIVLQALIGATQELDRRLREQLRQQTEAAKAGAVEGQATATLAAREEPATDAPPAPVAARAKRG